MKTLNSLVLLLLLSSSVFSKDFPIAGYDNYTMNTNMQQITSNMNVPANIGDSVKLTAYFVMSAVPEYGTWYFNGSPLSYTGVGSITVDISAYGIYTVPLTLGTITLTIVPANATGIETTGPISSFNIYPAVVSSAIHIEMTLAGSELVVIKIYTATGKCVKELWSGKITGELKLEENMEMMTAGIYFVSVSSGNSLLSRKIIKI